MAPLRQLEQKLTRLRWYRWSVAAGGSLCALGIALLWSLLFLAALDISFQLPVSQRVVTIGIVAVVAAGLVWKRVAAGVSWPADQQTTALLVERNHRLDTDLVAALQFQASGLDARLGSPRLRQSVIERAAKLAESLDFFQGIGAGALPARATTLSLTLAATVGLALAFPAHAEVFWKRLALGSEHYPSRVQLDQVLVNGAVVLTRESPTFGPGPAKCAEGRPIELLVRCSGLRPVQGDLTVRSGGQEVQLPLPKLSPRDRLQRLRRAEEALRRDPPDLPAAAYLAKLDCAEAAELLQQEQPDTIAAATALAERLAQGETALDSDVDWYAAELPRHGADLRYDLRIGDAWTEEGRIEVLALPTIALHAVAMAPEYAGLGEVAMSQGARQLRVLEGSRVDLSIECLNHKPLESAWAMLMRDGETPQRVPLVMDGERWRLPAEGTPLWQVRERIQFSLHVLDEDGLELPTPITGQIQMRPDRPPSGSATVLHRVVLPQATPRLSIRAADDFGLRELRLRLLVEHPQQAIETAAPGVDAGNEPPATEPPASPSASGTSETLIPIRRFVDGENSPLPLELEHPLSLAPLQLAKGDRVKITLEIVDNQRRDPASDQPSQGNVFRADPLVLEVSDEAGVLAAVSETDEQSERKLNELIQQQLGIGDSE
ncbi:MAG: hypothetical protein KDB14_07420 [Planctomycetales bacterium]|nr:hypothetical protein [Planctomycetales bacterium]